MATALVTGMAGGFGEPARGRNAETVVEPEAAGARIVEMDVTDTASTAAGVAEAVVIRLDLPFGRRPFRTVVDHAGVGPGIERCNDALHDVARAVPAGFGVARLFALNA